MEEYLTWDNSFEIALLLSERLPDVNLHDVSLGDILEWTKMLPEFSDDDHIVTEQILMDIFCEWLEEDLSK